MDMSLLAHDMRLFGFQIMTKKERPQPKDHCGGQAFIIWQCLLLVYIQCNILFMVIFVFLQLQGPA